MSHEAELPGIRVSKDQLRIILARYAFAAKFISGKIIFEAGCGPGLGLGYFARTAKKIVAADISEENLNYARNYYKGKDYAEKIEIINLDSLKIASLKNYSFDVIISLAAVYAFDLDMFLNECIKMLRTGGKIIFDLPNKDIPAFKKSEFSKNYYSVPDLFELIKKYGLDAKIFGAFPVSRGPGSKYRRNFKADLISNISRIITSLPGGKRIKTFLDKFILKKSVLTKAIESKDMEIIKDVKFNPLKNIVNSNYRILYVIAGKK